MIGVPAGIFRIPPFRCRSFILANLADCKSRAFVLDFRQMDTPQITAYLKTSCGWSAGVRAVLAKYNLPYTEKDIIQNPAFRWEMETKSGQPLSPCVDINGQMLPDVSGEEVEKYLVDNKIVQSSDAQTDVPINAACATEQHESNVKLNF
jgi:glutaredoxin-related protein